MTDDIRFSEQLKTRKRIYNTIANLKALPKVKIYNFSDTFDSFEIHHDLEFVPNFSFSWCPASEHYRVSIIIANRESPKRDVGYCICTIKNGLAAMGFGTLYTFLHKHRANNKQSA